MNKDRCSCLSSPGGFFRQPSRDMDRLNFRDGEATAPLGELLQEVAMPIVAIEIELHPVEEMIKQFRNEQSMGRNDRRGSGIRTAGCVRLKIGH